MSGILASQLTLRNYINAGYRGIVYETSEEGPAVDEILFIAKKTKRRLFVWSQTKGIQEYIDVKVDSDDDKKPDDAYTLDMENYKIKTRQEKTMPNEDVFIEFNNIVDEEEKQNGAERYLYVILDFHPHMNNPEVQRMIKDCVQPDIVQKRGSKITYIFVSAKFDVPKDLEHYMVVVKKQLPTKEMMLQLANQLCSDQNVNLTDKEISDAADAVMGLTITEATDALSMSMSKTRGYDMKLINDLKKEIICKDGLLNYTETGNESLETVGGMKIFTQYVMERLSGFSEEAREENIPYPKGVLLVGIPGCGKSLAAKALANMWKKPLLQLDLGKLFGSYVGQTEERTRDTLKLAEAMAPCILWLDEIEKGLSGVRASGSTDSGVTSRMFGTILTWLQEKKKPVFVIATANSIKNLPDELLRKGRFDEIFFVDLPNFEERVEIFEIQIKKYQGKKYKVSTVENKAKGKTTYIDVKALAEITEGFSGAEIESVITTAKVRAFNQKRSYTMEDLKEAIHETHAASLGFMKDTVEGLRHWRDENYIRNANAEQQVKEVLDEAEEKNQGGKLGRDIVMCDE